MKKYLLIILLSAGTLNLASCGKWLSLEPENDLIREEFWKSKEEVESVLASGYLTFAANAQRLFYWGELRGGTLVEGASPNDDQMKIINLEISQTNEQTRWYFVYQAINYANEVIKYAPAVVEKDPSLNEAKMKGLLAEAYFIRALGYFYLVRVFGEVPYSTEPSDDDGKDYYIPKTAGTEILKNEVRLLDGIVDFATESFDNPAYNKGRATKAALYALIADIRLWLEQPQLCLDALGSLYELGGYTLVAQQLWYNIFLNGNSNETLFELKYSVSLGTSNPLVSPLLFNVGKRLAVNEEFVMEFDDLNDIRGTGNTFLQNGLRYEIWKVAGMSNDKSDESLTDQRRAVGVNDDNPFIVYRYADILLMQAEALTLLGRFDEARELLLRVMQRAGVATVVLDLPDDESAVLKAILDERKKEFAFEGKRWFDVLRIAKHKDFANKDFLVEAILASVSSVDQARVEAVLRDNNSLYLPIYKDELDNNKALEQNSFYKY